MMTGVQHTPPEGPNSLPGQTAEEGSQWLKPTKNPAITQGGRISTFGASLAMQDFLLGRQHLKWVVAFRR